MHGMNTVIDTLISYGLIFGVMLVVVLINAVYEYFAERSKK